MSSLRPRRYGSLPGNSALHQSHWKAYSRRNQTRREHLLELQAALQLRPLTVADYRPAVLALVDLAMQTDKGLILAQALM
ncbi:hypothetical protein LMG28138_05282 [Pararobbsia alpina]|uniref:DUF4158 domain-containing protein n=1 Tax=Pararobbsia alpina TaxID=621374 RepID=A0A6S7BUC6_9BURK|nr:hypothetical protein LMG28138_05282 [Pararobbsia alpina]